MTTLVKTGNKMKLFSKKTNIILNIYENTDRVTKLLQFSLRKIERKHKQKTRLTKSTFLVYIVLLRTRHFVTANENRFLSQSVTTIHHRIVFYKRIF